jgi:hypothetical protein
MRTVKGKRVPPTKSLNKLAAMSALHEALGSCWVEGDFAILCVAARVLQQSLPCTKHRCSLPSTAAMSCQRVPFPTAHPPLALHTHLYDLTTVAGGKKLHRQSATTMGRPMTCSGNNRRCTPVERALELPLSMPMGDVENVNNDNARS